MDRHPFDVVSFLFGALFIGAGVSAVLFNAPFSSLDWRWVWPVVLILAGAAVLGATLSSGRSARKEAAETDLADEEPLPVGLEAAPAEDATVDVADGPDGDIATTD